MSVNWTTVIATIINFLVLVFLLRRFLYGPILKVMDEREQKIVQREEEAAEKARQAEAEAGEYRQKTASLATRDEELLGEAREAAAVERRSLVDQARREVAETRQGWQEALSREKESFARELRRQVAGQASRIARRCLQDLADARLEEMAWDTFLKKVGALPAEELAKLKEALSASQIQVSGAFEVGETKLALLQNRLKELLSVDVILEYRQDPSLVCGLELEAGGHRVAWSVDSYLADVEQQILKSLETAKQVKEDTSDGF